jgi:hypothetical protein
VSSPPAVPDDDLGRIFSPHPPRRRRPVGLVIGLVVFAVWEVWAIRTAQPMAVIVGLAALGGGIALGRFYGGGLDTSTVLMSQFAVGWNPAILEAIPPGDPVIVAMGDVFYDGVHTAVATARGQMDEQPWNALVITRSAVLLLTVGVTLRPRPTAYGTPGLLTRAHIEGLLQQELSSAPLRDIAAAHPANWVIPRSRIISVGPTVRNVAVQLSLQGAPGVAVIINYSAFTFRNPLPERDALIATLQGR